MEVELDEMMEVDVVMKDGDTQKELGERKNLKSYLEIFHKYH
jgi:hypothetical protein